MMYDELMYLIPIVLIGFNYVFKHVKPNLNFFEITVLLNVECVSI